ncbi:uncharacterized protein LOC9643892 [Selaginella moellendorffii]|uniref:uncharacterized protein LOC9643892 n=1 Tax=Selaginella moellendorffii TaxID=88036 RepID=UPI000D1CC2EE|nr:uncharacterized protein LOC9643892 [Selaginella moellendorffii]|eukprot:XP_024545027.1 uncharacterized protein LOC9643892 [Selaginella moellendorffii]
MDGHAALTLVAKLWRSIITRFWLEPRSLDARIRSQNPGAVKDFRQGDEDERQCQGAGHDRLESRHCGACDATSGPRNTSALASKLRKSATVPLQKPIQSASLSW